MSSILFVRGAAVAGLSVLLAATSWAQAKKEDPVGLVMLPGGSKVLRSGAESPLSAKPGDILFPGDSVRTEGSPASMLFCPAKASLNVAASSDILLDAKQYKMRSGKIAGQTAIASCFLPQVVRVATASQQHYGISMTRSVAGSEDAPQPEAIPAEAAAELAPVESALAANAKDQGALVAQAAIYEKYKLKVRAVNTYKIIAAEWKDAVWTRGKIFELDEAIADERAAQAALTATEGGQTFAILIGISEYQKLPKEQWLQYAHADALTFEKHFKSPRGGGLPPENVILLTNEKATTASVRNALNTFKGRAGKKDTILVVVVGHGTVEIPGNRAAYVVTYDSDPQDLKNTALPMDEVQAFITLGLPKIARMAIFVDVCRTATIGSIRNTAVNGAVEKLGAASGEILGLMASRPKELAIEGKEFGEGHGAFSYHLLKALNGDADKNGDKIVNVNEVIDYVQTKVRDTTNGKQHSREFGTMDNAVVLSDTNKPGIEMTRLPFLYDSGGEPLYLAQASPQAGQISSDSARAIERFSEALKAGRIMPQQPNSAFQVLPDLRKLPRAQYLMYENQLRVALEDRGQQVLLRYLAGDQVPQTKTDFASAADYMKAAQALTPESLFLDGRDAFFRGRSLLFDKQYADAADLLERSVRVDPGGAYTYNALGIAYLEQAKYQLAIQAFRDASRRAQLWAYPLHNLALAYAETGDYNAAIRSYLQAIKLTPQYFYLPYNLGLVYQRMNRRKEAEAAYKKAISLSPDSAEPYNAMGSLKASTGKAADAEKFYKTALAKNEGLLPARENLAQLISQKQGRADEAIALWRENLKRQPDYLPSRLSLAAALEAKGDAKAAVEEYRAIAAAQPKYLAARLALAGVLQKAGDAEGAAAELKAALALEPSSSMIFERIGDMEKARNRTTEAAAAYESALKNAPDNQVRKRIRNKMKGAGSSSAKR